MSKVTSKLQVTVPKALAERYGIRPGDDIRFEGTGEIIRVVPANVDARLHLFDAATERQRKREECRRTGSAGSREELYERGPANPD